MKARFMSKMLAPKRGDRLSRVDRQKKPRRLGRGFGRVIVEDLRRPLGDSDAR